MKRVIIESPYAGDIRKNEIYARACMKDSLLRGEAPFASHLFYTQVLDDTVPEEREIGMIAGLSWTCKADLVAVYWDLGVSSGMVNGIRRAVEHGITVEGRRLEGKIFG